MYLIRNSPHALMRVDRSHIVSPTSAYFLIKTQSPFPGVTGLDELRRSIKARTDEDVHRALIRREWLLISKPTTYASPSQRALPPVHTTLYNAPGTPGEKEQSPEYRAKGAVFAKSCLSGRWGDSEAGERCEPATHFGNILVAKSKPVPFEAANIVAATGADTALGRITGGGIMQRGYAWMLRGATTAAGPAAIFVAGMLPTRMGDSTLYSDDELRALSTATTRVRFQFRRDAQGELQLYGIHTGSTSGQDSVTTTKARWSADRRTLQADLGGGVSIIWTPDKGPLSTPELTHPQADDQAINTILVHPIAADSDSQIEGYPAIDDITLGDRIITFPVDSGLSSLYVVYSKPLPEGHAYHSPPKELIAFPDARRVKSKSNVQGGGAKRDRWMDSRGRIFEWDRQHGRVEMYNRQGKHLGEFDAETGKQTKPANPSRTTEK